MGRHRDRLQGGQADAKSPKDFDPAQLKAGTAHEREHTEDEGIAQEIAMDHLTEDPDYYKKLKTIEKAQLFIFKAKKVPIGTRSKWADGIYIKHGDHKWHKEKLTKIAHATVNNKKKNDPKLKSEFTAAVHAFVSYLEKNDLHPEKISTKDLNGFWADVIGDKNFHKDAGWKKYVKIASDVAKQYHQELTEHGKNRQNIKSKANPEESWAKNLRLKTADMNVHDRDVWVGEQFRKAKKPIGHILYACRQILGSGANERQTGFKAFCQAILQKSYEHGPTGIESETLEIWNKAFKTLLERKERKDVPLKQALSMAHSKAFFKNNVKWFRYCAERMSRKNEGMVDMLHIERYMINAMNKHKKPPAVDYDE